MTLSHILQDKIKEGFLTLFQTELPSVEFQATRKEFEGDITVVLFPMLKYVKSNPEQIGNQLGNYLINNRIEVAKFNVVKGFLNLVIADNYYLDFLKGIMHNSSFGFEPVKDDLKAIMVEYASPNTNKPLHLGHIRNVLLGYAIAEILKASGRKVYKTQIINDRGIHICKSMLAWKKYGKGETPESTGQKGDKLVGNYYVRFDQEYKEQINLLKQEGITEEVAISSAPLLLEWVGI